MDELNLPSRAWEKRLAETQDFLASVGLVAAGRCKYCGAVITDPKSLAVKAGSVCRVRHGKENDPAGNVAKQSPGKAA